MKFYNRPHINDRVAKLLLDRKADPNSRALNGFTPLHIACKKNRIKVVELLLKYGASLNHRNKQGGTCLLMAASNGKLDMVKWLLKYGFQLNERLYFSQHSCLILACRGGYIDLVKYLVLEKKCSLQEISSRGTCIMQAARLKHTNLVIWMLTNGSSIDENTALDFNGHIVTIDSCEDILKDNGMYNDVKRTFTIKSSRK